MEGVPFAGLLFVPDVVADGTDEYVFVVAAAAAVVVVVVVVRSIAVFVMNYFAV